MNGALKADLHLTRTNLLSVSWTAALILTYSKNQGPTEQAALIRCDVNRDHAVDNLMSQYGKCQPLQQFIAANEWAIMEALFRQQVQKGKATQTANPDWATVGASWTIAGYLSTYNYTGPLGTIGDPEPYVSAACNMPSLYYVNPLTQTLAPVQLDDYEVICDRRPPDLLDLIPF